MKRIISALALAALLVAFAAQPAQADGHDLNGVSVKVENTIESVAFDFPEETPFGEQGPVAINATIEFAECCDGFYEVDLTGNQISMRWIGAESFARVIEEGTYDRYYFTFGEPVLASASTSSSSTLPVITTVLSPTELLVEVGPGMQVGAGFDALIDVNVSGDANELAFTGVETGPLAVIGVTSIVAGLTLVAWSRER